MKFFPALALAVLCTGTAVFAAEPSRPNIVFIISDDHGWTDYSFMGHPQIETPHLDKLAARSAVFPRWRSPARLNNFIPPLYLARRRNNDSDLGFRV